MAADNDWKTGQGRNSLRNASAAVNLVHRQLECLKYIGGQEDHKPTGEGINTDIVTLPDLVIDILSYHLDGPTPWKALALGGRAAKAASALAHLLTDEDGAYRIHLVTRAKKLERLLLENQFSEPLEHTLLDLECMLPLEGEPRFAVQKKSSAPLLAIPHKHHQELTTRALEEPPVREALRRARTVYLSSVKSEDFAEMASFLAEHLDKDRQWLLMDLTRADHRHLEQVLEFLKHAPPSQRHKLLGLFLRTQEEKLLLTISGESTLEDFSRNYQTLAVLSAGREIRYIDANGQAHGSLHSSVDLKPEYLFEWFKAGVLLAATVFKAVDDIKHVCAPLFDKLRGQWGREPWEQIVSYGVALATAVEQTREHCTLASLAGAEPRIAQEHLPDHAAVVVEQETAHFAATRQHGSLRLDLERLDPLLCARLAGLRRAGGLRAPDLPLNPPIDSGHAGPDSKGNATPCGPAAAVLLDLDGTLLDSTGQRNRGLAAGLAALQKSPNRPTHEDGESIENQAKHFTEWVYNLHPVYQELKLGDFRQEWNTPAWYTAFLVLKENDPLRKQLLAFWEQLQERARPNDPDPDDIRKALEKADWRGDFLDTYARTAYTRGQAIRKAQDAFAAVKMHALKEARDLLKTLQLTQAFSLYIVSEGDSETQWFKIQNTGLDEFFERQRVLCTADASEPAEDRRELAVEMGRLQARVEAIEQKRTALREGMRLLDDLKVKIAETQSGNLRDIGPVLDQKSYELAASIGRLHAERGLRERQLRAAEFVDIVLTRMGHKGGQSFYGAVIRAILRNPESPLTELRAFRRLLERERIGRKMKFAMVGDRQKNDIDPPAQLLPPGGILTVRLLSGKYAKKEPPEEVKSPQVPPAYLAGTLSEVKAILLTKKAWQSVSFIDDPPIFGWKVLFGDQGAGYMPASHKEQDPKVGVDHVLCGIEMGAEYPIIYGVCSGVLAEHLGRCDREERDLFLRRYLTSDGTSGRNDESRQRVRILCALINASRLRTPWISAFGPEAVETIWKHLRTFMREQGRDSDAEVALIVDSLHLLEHEGEGQAQVLATERLQEVREKWGNDPRVRVPT